jgi:tRNA pseudouridine38-40 synthase
LIPSFDAWIRSTDSYAGNDLLYLNHKGIIPDAAVIKKGERRNNPFREKRRFDATGFPRSVGTAMDDGNEEEVADVYDEESFNNRDVTEMED